MLNAEIWEAQLVYASNEQLLEWAKSPEWKSVTRYPGRVRDQDGNQIDGSLGDELIRRMQAGRTEEVMELLERQNPAINTRLDRISVYEARPWEKEKDCPWHGDDQLWFRLAEVMAPLGYLPSSTDEWPARSPELTEQAKVWFTQYMEQLANRQEDGSLTNDADSYKGDIARSSIKLMYYPDMTESESLEYIRWLYKELNGADLFEKNKIPWQSFICAIPVSERQQLALHNTELAYDIISASSNGQHNNSDHWDNWIGFFEQYPEFLNAYNWIYDERIIEMWWDYNPDASEYGKKGRIEKLISLIDGNKANRARVTEVFDRLIKNNEDDFIRFFNKGKIQYPDLELTRFLLEKNHHQLIPGVLKEISSYAGCEYSKQSDYKPSVDKIITTCSEQVATLSGTELAGLLNLFDANMFEKTLPYITSVIKKNSSKSLVEALKNKALVIPLSQIEACGWVTKPSKKLMEAARDLLLERQEPEVIPLLEKLLASGKMDLGSASRVQEKLAAMGVEQSVAESDVLDGSLESLEKEAAGMKRFLKQIDQLATPDILSNMAPLSVQAGKVLLQLHVKAESLDVLPPLANQLLEHIPKQSRSSIARLLLKYWIDEAGDPKRKWLPRTSRWLAPEDNHLVDMLIPAINKWNGPKKSRAEGAVIIMATFDTDYALFRTQEIATSRKYKASINSYANLGLANAARRRGITLSDLLDDIMSDFGLTNGVHIDIGDKHYELKLQGDLTLRVISDNGKSSKSVPKPRKAEYLPEWELAQEQFKSLRKSIGLVARRQKPRMLAALEVGKCWSLDRWRRLFVQHALMGALGRSLIWCADSGQSFRISEDLSLVDVNDDAVELSTGSQIRLWHPVRAQFAEEGAQWQAYLADYELEPLIDQFSVPRQLPKPDQIRCGNRILAPEGLIVYQGKLSALLKKLGYQEGNITDGPTVENHSLNFAAEGIQVNLIHGRFPAFWGFQSVEPIKVEYLEIYKSQTKMDVSALTLEQQATLMGHLKQMEALAIKEESAAES